VGRFYVAWLPPGDKQSDKKPYKIAATEGNDIRAFVTSKRLIVSKIRPDIYNVWQHGDGSVSLLYDLRFDAHLRAAWTYDSGTFRDASFSKLADQILYGVIKDQDDFAVMMANLRCSIKGPTVEPCPL